MATGNLANWTLYVLSFHYFLEVIQKRCKGKSGGPVFSQVSNNLTKDFGKCYL